MVLRECSALVLVSILGLGLFQCRAAETLEIPTHTPADLCIFSNACEWRTIDLATNLPAGASRNVSPDFLRWLLTTGQDQINHVGLRLRNATIQDWLDLENLDIPADVQFEDCIFETNVNFSGAHFHHNLSFQECEFDGPFIANALQVDGSLRLKSIRFCGMMSLNGAVIGGKLDTPAAEFLGVVDCTGLKVGSDILMSNARFDSSPYFRHAQTGHDFDLTKSLFNADFDCSAMNVGGSLIINEARFGGKASFQQVLVGDAFLGSGSRFENEERMTDFSGLKVSGLADFSMAQFAGPVSFILAQIGGNLNCQGTRFEDAHNFEELSNITCNASTFNTDFGSMEVDGFAIFYNAYFGRSVSFRNARLENLYFDGVQWPETNYTTNPSNSTLLRVESLDFQTIRDITGDRFDHTPQQLVESESNLVCMLRERSPYSFDVYSKLEDYFLREGEPGLADKVFIEAKRREGEEASGFGAKFVNKVLYLTVGYGRLPWLAFFESCGCVMILSVLCCFCMEDKKHKQQPGIAISMLYSLDKFLPIIDLNTGDLLDFKKNREWFRYALAFGRILGYVLVPLWTISLAGLIK